MLQGVYSVEGKTNGFSEFMWLRENFGKNRVVHVDEANRYNYSEFALLRANPYNAFTQCKTNCYGEFTTLGANRYGELTLLNENSLGEFTMLGESHSGKFALCNANRYDEFRC